MSAKAKAPAREDGDVDPDKNRQKTAEQAEKENANPPAHHTTTRRSGSKPVASRSAGPPKNCYSSRELSPA